MFEGASKQILNLKNSTAPGSPPPVFKFLDPLLMAKDLTCLCIQINNAVFFFQSYTQKAYKEMPIKNGEKPYQTVNRKFIRFMD